MKHLLKRLQAPHPLSHDTLNWAHISPFLVFMGILVILDVTKALIGWNHPSAPWWRQDPAHWIYPLQCIFSLVFLFYYRNCYSWNYSLRWSIYAIFYGIIGITLWITPVWIHTHFPTWVEAHPWMQWLGCSHRSGGFNPFIFDSQLATSLTLGCRIFRAVIVVSLIEEIFWRGFLMRFAARYHGNYWSLPIGHHSWVCCIVVTLSFALVHSSADRFVATIYGLITYLLCIQSKSMGACIVMHATANAILCAYILKTGQYGLW